MQRRKKNLSITKFERTFVNERFISDFHRNGYLIRMYLIVVFLCFPPPLFPTMSNSCI